MRAGGDPWKSKQEPGRISWFGKYDHTEGDGEVVADVIEIDKWLVP